MELSTLRTRSSSTLSGGASTVPGMGGSLKERLIEVADTLRNDAELARIALVSRSAVSQWRHGDVKELKALSALNIQERTGFSARWLVLGKGPKRLGDKETSQLLSIPARLSPTDEQNLLAVLRWFLETDEDGRTEIFEAVKALSDTREPSSAGWAKSPRSRKRR